MTRRRSPRLALLVAGTVTLSAAVAGCAASPSGKAPAAMPIALTLDHWQLDGAAEFVPTEGFPDGLLKLGDGRAVSRNLVFADGTIEYDAKLSADGFASVEFRRRDAGTSEIFYLRPDGDCPAANDCVQYVPRYHGVWPWEMYPEYQASAPVTIGGWNHVRLVVSGRRMDVFLNRAPDPVLRVGHLAGDALAGGLELVGPAAFANLVVTPGATGGLSPAPVPDPSARDRTLVRDWQVSAPFSLAFDASPGLAAMPSAADAWRTIPVEPNGLVNLSRRYGSPTDKSTGAAAWLRTTVLSDRERTVTVSFGFLHEAWVWVNGAPVFVGRNVYYPESGRRPPDGRISLANGTFSLPLRQGRNDIVVALNNILGAGHAHYGWGLEMRVDDPTGLTLTGHASDR